MKVLVLNCFSRNALAVINSLDKSYELYGAAPHGKFSLIDGVFKHEKLRKVLRYTNSNQDASLYKSDLVQLIKDFNIEVVIPTGTTETDILSTFKEEIESTTKCKLLVESFSKLENLTDKDKLIKRAEELGLSVPRSFYCKNIDELKQLTTSELMIPFILKPVRSYASKGLHIFQHEDEFEGFLNSEASKGYEDFIAQDFIDGEIHDACMLSKEGEVVYGLTQCRKMTWGNTGSGIINITTNDQESIEIATALLNDAGYTGISMFEFIKRTGDGKFFLIECNPKIWGTTDLTIKAGLNIVQDAIDLIVLGKPVKSKPYEKGLLYKWVFPECVSSMVLKKPRGIKTFVQEYKKTKNNYNSVRQISNLKVNSLKSLILEVLNKA